MVYISLFLSRNKLYNEKRNRIKLWMMLIVWISMIILWSVLANLLESKGINVFLEIWINSVILFLVNIYFLAEII
jgi:lipopolysaccharide export LptBFGC system permease protein LptF